MFEYCNLHITNREHSDLMFEYNNLHNTNREHPALFFKRPPRGQSAHEQEGVTAAYEKVSASSCSSHHFILHHHIARSLPMPYICKH
jgi:hypothetical protein